MNTSLVERLASGLTDDDLARLGEVAGKAWWNTPLIQIYGQGLTPAEELRRQRENNIRIGRSLLLLLEAS